MASKPTLFYFPVRGRVESIRYALAHSGAEWEEVAPEWEELKTRIDKYKFSQAPRFTDAGVDIVQGPAILRHLGRRYALYGGSVEEAARVDEALDGASDLFLVFTNKLRHASTHADPVEGAKLKEEIWATHADHELTASRVGLPDTRGAHLGYLSALVERGGTGWIAATAEPTIADFATAQTVEIFLFVYGRNRVAKQWPALVALVDRVHGLPGVAAYLKSPRRQPVLTPWLKSAEDWEAGATKEKPSWWAEQGKPVPTQAQATS